MSALGGIELGCRNASRRAALSFDTSCDYSGNYALLVNDLIEVFHVDLQFVSGCHITRVGRHSCRSNTSDNSNSVLADLSRKAGNRNLQSFRQ